jgi:hypothetical protein
MSVQVQTIAPKVEADGRLGYGPDRPDYYPAWNETTDQIRSTRHLGGYLVSKTDRLSCCRAVKRLR